MSSVSVIIPTLNEEEWIAGAVESAFAAGAAEVIVADGGSDDRTHASTRPPPAHAFSSPNACARNNRTSARTRRRTTR